MHIPDGYLSPETCAIAYAAVVPVWIAASRRVTATLTTASVPALAVFSSVSFLVMMINVPIPGGTSVHALGAVAVAIVLGPWAAVIAVSVALAFQALLFGDGGVLAFGANALNMAVLMPFAGVWAYRLVAGRSALTSRRRLVAAGVGGYVGINAAALAAAVEFGIQPGLFHTASGAPLYAPYPLSQTIPAMALAHLTIGGAVEAVLTAGVLAYLVRVDVRRLVPQHPRVPVHEGSTPPARSRLGRLTPTRAALGALVVMVVVSPLGLLAPGGAFGEEAPGDLDLASLGLAAVPTGLNRLNGFWNHTVLRDYGFADGQNATLAYWLSALVGIAVVCAAVFAVGWLVARLGRRREPVAGPAMDGQQVQP